MLIGHRSCAPLARASMCSSPLLLRAACSYVSTKFFETSYIHIFEFIALLRIVRLNAAANFGIAYQ